MRETVKLNVAEFASVLVSLGLWLVPVGIVRSQSPPAPAYYEGHGIVIYTRNANESKLQAEWREFEKISFSPRMIRVHTLDKQVLTLVPSQSPFTIFPDYSSEVSINQTLEKLREAARIYPQHRTKCDELAKKLEETLNLKIASKESRGEWAENPRSAANAIAKRAETRELEEKRKAAERKQLAESEIKRRALIQAEAERKVAEAKREKERLALIQAEEDRKLAEAERERQKIQEAKDALRNAALEDFARDRNAYDEIYHLAIKEIERLVATTRSEIESAPESTPVRTLTGQVFITVRTGNAVKLSGLEIAAVDQDAAENLWKGVAMRLGPVRAAFDTLRQRASSEGIKSVPSVINDLAKRKHDYDTYVRPYFRGDAIPFDIAAVFPLDTGMTDADGRFKFEVPHNRNILIISKGMRELSDEDSEKYTWVVAVPASPKEEEVMLTNQNALVTN